MKIAVIGTFHMRHENSFRLMHRLFVDGTRQPDEVWLLCETEEDEASLRGALAELYEMELIDQPVPANAILKVVSTPRGPSGYSVIPYSHKINHALSETDCEAIVYLDNGSMPSPDKYRIMAEALEAHPEWGAVYCTQARSGFNHAIHRADDPVADGYCVLNYTQVMHRWTSDKWSLDMHDANPDLADGLYWRQLHRTLGEFHPIDGAEIHDEHNIPSPAAAGL